MKTRADIFKIAYGKARILGKVEGAGNVNRMATRYTFSRKAGHGVSSALVSAVITKAGPEWYHGPSLGLPDGQGHRCVTAPSAYGLRFAGYSDELIGARHGSHEGWYTSHDGMTGETYRGCVFRIPGKDKHTRLLAAYRDVAGDCYIVDFSTVYTAIPDQSPTEAYDSFPYDAARAGDRMAEADAEVCREHDYKWQQASRWQDLNDELGTIKCECECADTERDRLAEQIKEIEGEFLDIAEFVRENL